MGGQIDRTLEMMRILRTLSILSKKTYESMDTTINPLLKSWIYHTNRNSMKISSSPIGIDCDKHASPYCNEHFSVVPFPTADRTWRWVFTTCFSEWVPGTSGSFCVFWSHVKRTSWRAKKPWMIPSNAKETGWWFQIFFIFNPIWRRFPFWLIFFKGVETTN